MSDFSMFDLPEGPDPVEASRKAGSQIQRAKHAVKKRIGGFFFNASTEAELHQRIKMASDQLDDIVRQHMPTISDAKAKLTRGIVQAWKHKRAKAPEKGTPEWHQYQVALKTLKMPDPIVNALGGMTKEEAQAIVDKYKSSHKQADYNSNDPILDDTTSCASCGHPRNNHIGGRCGRAPGGKQCPCSGFKSSHKQAQDDDLHGKRARAKSSKCLACNGVGTKTAGSVERKCLSCDGRGVSTPTKVSKGLKRTANTQYDVTVTLNLTLELDQEGEYTPQQLRQRLVDDLEGEELVGTPYIAFVSMVENVGPVRRI